MSDSDFFFNNKKRTGENYLPSSNFSRRKKSRILSKTAHVRLQNLHLPLISTATGSSVDSLILKPDRPYTIGRATRNCDFTVDNRFVSKQHCQILFDSIERKIYVIDGAFLLPEFSCVVNEFRKKRLLCSDKLLEEEDEGFSRVRVSLNGVFVNGVRLVKGVVIELNAGDEVLFVCRSVSSCRLRIRIGFVVLGIVFKEEVVLESLSLVGTMASSGHSPGAVSSGTRNKRVFAIRENDIGKPDCDFSKLKCSNLIGRASFLLGQCRNILNSDDPVSCIWQTASSDLRIMGTHGCFSTKFPGRFSVGGDLKVKMIETLSQQEQKPCDKITHVGQSGSITYDDERIVVLEAENDLVDPYVHNDHIHHKVSVGDGHIHHKVSVGVSNKGAIPGDNSKDLLLNSADRENDTHFHSMDKSNSGRSSFSAPGKKFYLNRLEYMDLTSPNHNVISLPELLSPVESISKLFIATFTSDILWFLSSCEIPYHLTVTIACHNTERCWSSSADKRTSVPYPEFPNLVVVFPPFPESVAFGENRKNHGIACHHPKLFVVQREDSIRVIVTSANLVAKQ